LSTAGGDETELGAEGSELRGDDDEPEGNEGVGGRKTRGRGGKSKGKAKADV